ncbi:MAG: hypothetical protein ABSC56_09090 [Solirubrobacteraceae bacterium]|jgi:hypothetical protein
MSSEDWRVETRLADSGAAKQLHAAAGAAKLYAHARVELYGRASLSHDDDRVFAYADTREHAQAAQQALEALAAQEGLSASYTLQRWHPLAERWEDPDVPLPSDPAAVAEEESEGAQSDRELESEEAKRTGVPEFEVRVTLPTHSDAVALAKKLAAESIPSQRHWHFLLIGAWTEDDANLLAERIRADAPAGSEVRVENTLAYILSQEPHSKALAANPFVLF